jgi:hypothetical protein
VYEAIKIILPFGLELMTPQKWSWVGFRRTCSGFSRKKTWIGRSIIILIVLSLVIISSEVSVHSQELDTFPKWSRVEIEFTGPSSLGMGSPNPFQIQVDVTFTGPASQVFTVPAFYDGDGAGGLDGDIWKVRFSPNIAGTWTYITSSTEGSLNGLNGTFLVSDTNGCQTTVPGGLPNFACVGRLEYTGEHYLKFAEGPYWLKGGINEPEDFLDPEVNAGFGNKHAAIDYLAGTGINSMYLMLTNIDGDRRNIWPWVGNTQDEAKLNHERFDVAKLEDWENTFTYIQQKGLVLHIVFEDDSAWIGFNRSMYYREIVARFGHHNGLYWNLAEEYNEVYSADQMKDYAQILSNLDPYDHPITVHQQGGLNNWDPFVGDSRFDLTSFQTGDSPQNSPAVDWFAKVENSSRTIPVAFDESTRNLTSDERDMFRHIAWSIYTGGANFEVYTRLLGSSYLNFDLILEDLARARKYIDDLSFWEMRPKNELLLSGEGYVFTQSGETYLVYLPDGGSISLDLSGSESVFDAEWFNPRSGAIQSIGFVSGGAPYAISAPDSLDWVLLLKVVSPPQIISTPLTQGTVGQLYQYDVDASGDPIPTFDFVSAPQGMTIETRSGLIKWVPASNGEYAVEVQAENAAGSDSQNFTLKIIQPPTPTSKATIEPTPSKTPPPDIADIFIYIPVAQK